MVYKNQESCESQLVEFWVGRNSKMQKNSAQNLFFCIFEPPLWIY